MSSTAKRRGYAALVTLLLLVGVVFGANQLGVLDALKPALPYGSAPAAPPSASPEANKAKKATPLPARDADNLQSGLNSRTKDGQAATLVSGLRDGSWNPAKVLPEGATLAIQRSTFRKEGGRHVVDATISGSRAAAFRLHLQQEEGKWLIYSTERTDGNQPSAHSSASPAGFNGGTNAVAEANDGLSLAPAAHSRPLANEGNCVATKGKTPVLLVHGFNSNPGMWGERDEPSSMNAAIGGLSGVNVDVFDYRDAHFNWVTDDDIGPKLAQRISCLYGVSGKKVVIVAHSMGGLAARYAVNQPGIARMIGLVVTIGTPHLGSLLGNAGTKFLTGICQGVVSSMVHPVLGSLMNKDTCLANLAVKGLAKNSRELAELPHFPDGIPVRAIAGDMTVALKLLEEVIYDDTHSDEVVGVDSATAEYTTDGRGGGKIVLACRGQVYLVSSGFCNHNQLPNAPEVQASVKKAIELYLASIATMTHKASGGVVIPTQSGWEITHQDARTTIIRDTGHCNTNLDDSMEPYRAQIEKSKLWCAGMVITNLAAPQTEASDGVTCDNDGQSQDVTVGGASATFTKRTNCSNGIVVGKSSLRSWNIPSKKVVIDVYDLPDNTFYGANAAIAELQWS